MWNARNIARATHYKSRFVVKAQVQTSGRKNGYFKETGYKGGVQFVDSPEQAKEIADKMIGNKLVT